MISIGIKLSVVVFVVLAATLVVAPEFLRAQQESYESNNQEKPGFFSGLVKSTYRTITGYFKDNGKDLIDAIRSKGFESFMKIHNKSYSGDELKSRFEVFAKRLSMVQDWNEKYQQGSVSYTLKTNKFSDLFDDELDTMYGLKLPANFSHADKFSDQDLYEDEDVDLYLHDNEVDDEDDDDEDDDDDLMRLALKQVKARGRVTQLPASKDWRSCLTAIRDQGSCGSCYAFATADAITASKCIHWNERPVEMSTQQIVDCGHQFDRHGMDGCDGGWPSNVLDYLQRKDMAAERNYPYRAREQSCQYNQLAKKRALLKTGHSSPSPKYRELTRDSQFKFHLANTGPIITAMYASRLFNWYSTGVFNDFTCRNQDVNHAVLLVGYGSENGRDYWLVRNSYGTEWGEQGYMKIRQGQCQIGTIGWVITKN